MINIATKDSVVEHWGSAVSPPILSTFNGNNFVTIEDVDVMDTRNTIDTPSHIYAFSNGTPLFHSHSNQVVDDIAQSWVTIEGYPILLEGDKHIAEDTRIVSSGQEWAKIY